MVDLRRLSYGREVRGEEGVREVRFMPRADDGSSLLKAASLRFHPSVGRSITECRNFECTYLRGEREEREGEREGRERGALAAG